MIDEPPPWIASTVGPAAPSYASLQGKAKQHRAKRFSLGFCILFFPLLFLSLLADFSNVHTTIKYGPYWLIAWAALMFLLSVCAWGTRVQLHAALFPNGNASLGKIVGAILSAVLGIGTVAGFAVWGGVPILAHGLTAHPGELTVTVISKESNYQRRSCRPRLKIAEFTFFLHNHICSSDRAFSQIDVGATIRLQGQVSPFGVSVDRYVWKVHE